MLAGEDLDEYPMGLETYHANQFLDSLLPTSPHIEGAALDTDHHGSPDQGWGFHTVSQFDKKTLTDLNHNVVALTGELEPCSAATFHDGVMYGREGASDPVVGLGSAGSLHHGTGTLAESSLESAHQCEDSILTVMSQASDEPGSTPVLPHSGQEPSNAMMDIHILSFPQDEADETNWFQMDSHQLKNCSTQGERESPDIATAANPEHGPADPEENWKPVGMCDSGYGTGVSATNFSSGYSSGTASASPALCPQLGRSTPSPATVQDGVILVPPHFIVTPSKGSPQLAGDAHSLPGTVYHPYGLASLLKDDTCFPFGCDTLFSPLDPRATSPVPMENGGTLQTSPVVSSYHPPVSQAYTVPNQAKQDPLFSFSTYGQAGGSIVKFANQNLAALRSQSSGELWSADQAASHILNTVSPHKLLSLNSVLPSIGQPSPELRDDHDDRAVSGEEVTAAGTLERTDRRSVQMINFETETAAGCVNNVIECPSSSPCAVEVRATVLADLCGKHSEPQVLVTDSGLVDQTATCDDLPVTSVGGLPVTSCGDDLPVTSGCGNDLPVTSGCDDLPVTSGCDDLPVTSGGDDLLVTSGGDDDLPVTSECVQNSTVTSTNVDGLASQYLTAEVPDLPVDLRIKHEEPVQQQLSLIGQPKVLPCHLAILQMDSSPRRPKKELIRRYRKSSEGGPMTNSNFNGKGAAQHAILLDSGGSHATLPVPSAEKAEERLAVTAVEGPGRVRILTLAVPMTEGSRAPAPMLQLDANSSVPPATLGQGIQPVCSQQQQSVRPPAKRRNTQTSTSKTAMGKRKILPRPIRPYPPPATTAMPPGELTLQYGVEPQVGPVLGAWYLPLPQSAPFPTMVFQEKPPGEPHKAKWRLKPRHYDVGRMQIGQYEHVIQDIQKYFKLKLIFRKRKIVYEWEVPGVRSMTRRGSRICIFAVVEIALDTVVGLQPCGDSSLILEVNTMPSMYQGYRPTDPDGHYSPHQMASYERKRLVDFTGLQLTTAPYHQIQLQQPKVNKLLQHMCDFDPRFRAVLKSPFRLDVGRCLPSQAAAKTVSRGPVGPSDTEYTHGSVTAGNLRVVDVRRSSKKKASGCTCIAGCLFSRCGCVHGARACTQLCSCMAEYNNCVNPINQMTRLGVDLPSARRDDCLMVNVFRIKDLHNYLERDTMLPCCEVNVKVGACVPGLVVCPLGCGAHLKYSWCNNQLFDEEKMPRNHCKSCNCCSPPKFRHCEICNTCYLPVSEFSGLCPCQCGEILRPCGKLDVSDSPGGATDIEMQQPPVTTITTTEEAAPPVGLLQNYADAADTSIDPVFPASITEGEGGLPAELAESDPELLVTLCPVTGLIQACDTDVDSGAWDGICSGSVTGVVNSGRMDSRIGSQSEQAGVCSQVINGDISGGSRNGSPNGAIDSGSPNGVIDSGSPNGVFESGSPNGVLDNGSPNGVLDNGSPNGVLDNGSPNGVLENGSPNSVPDNGSPNGVLDNGSPNGVLDNGSPNGVLENGSPNGVPDNGSPNGVLDNGSPNGVIESGSPNGVLDNGSPNGVPDDGSPNGVLDNGSPNGVPKNGSPNGVLDNGSPNGVLDNGSPNGVPDDGSPNGVLDNGSPNGVPKNGSPNGVLDNGSPNGVLDNGSPNGVLDNGSPNGVLDNGSPNGILDNESPNGVIESSSPNCVLENGSSNGVLDNSSPTCVIDSGYAGMLTRSASRKLRAEALKMRPAKQNAENHKPTCVEKSKPKRPKSHAATKVGRNDKDSCGDSLQTGNGRSLPGCRVVVNSLKHQMPDSRQTGVLLKVNKTNKRKGTAQGCAVSKRNKTNPSTEDEPGYGVSKHCHTDTKRQGKGLKDKQWPQMEENDLLANTPVKSSSTRAIKEDASAESVERKVTVVGSVIHGQSAGERSKLVACEQSTSTKERTMHICAEQIKESGTTEYQPGSPFEGTRVTVEHLAGANGSKVTVHLGSASAPHMIRECNKLMHQSGSVGVADADSQPTKSERRVPWTTTGAQWKVATPQFQPVQTKSHSPASTNIEWVKLEPLEKPGCETTPARRHARQGKNLMHTKEEEKNLVHIKEGGQSKQLAKNPREIPVCSSNLFARNAYVCTPPWATLSQQRAIQLARQEDEVYNPPWQDCDLDMTLENLAVTLGEPLKCSSPIVQVKEPQ